MLYEEELKVERVNNTNKTEVISENEQVIIEIS